MLKLNPAVGVAIRVARKAAGLSQAQLARACGVTVGHIFAIEHGSGFNVALLLEIVEQLPALRLRDVADALLSVSAGRSSTTPLPLALRRDRSQK
jgi:transcriptional regulator with XRE-family HTH domain